VQFFPSVSIAATSTAPATTLGALSISIPPELWAALGISVTSLFAQPLILTVKQNDGRLDTNGTRGDALPSDLFQGDDTSNSDSIDLSKVQMFFFTVVLVMGYGAAIANSLYQAAGASPMRFGEFPPLDSSLITLLAISHAGYLVYKAVPHSGPASDIAQSVDGFVQPVEFAPGDMFNVTAAGFNAGTAKTMDATGTVLTPAVNGEAVDLELRNSDGKLQRALTPTFTDPTSPHPDESGVYIAQFDSTGLDEGQYTLQLTGKNSGHESLVYFKVKKT
jgi:hypothetical protein